MTIIFTDPYQTVFTVLGAILTASVGIGLVLAGITKAARAALRKAEGGKHG